MRKIFFNDDDLQKQLQINGYVVVDLLNEEQVAELNRRFFQLKPDDNFYPGNGRYHCTFVDTNKEYKKAAYDLFMEIFDKKINELLIDFELLAANFYVKQPGSGEFEIHQNWATLDETKHTSVPVWSPLHDTTELNATIEVVPGSHKIYKNITANHAPYFFHNFTQALKDKYLKPVNLKAGQAIIFDDNLIHYSKKNNSDKERKAVQLAYVPKEAQKIFYYLDPANLEGEFEMYETNKEFYWNHNNSDVVGRPPLKFLGNTPNHNVIDTEEGFAEKLSRGGDYHRAFFGS